MTTTVIINDHLQRARHWPKDFTDPIRPYINPASWLSYLRFTDVEIVAWICFNLAKITQGMWQNEIPKHVP